MVKGQYIWEDNIYLCVSVIRVHIGKYITRTPIDDIKVICISSKTFVRDKLLSCPPLPALFRGNLSQHFVCVDGLGKSVSGVARSTNLRLNEYENGNDHDIPRHMTCDGSTLAQYTFGGMRSKFSGGMLGASRRHSWETGTCTRTAPCKCIGLQMLKYGRWV